MKKKTKVRRMFVLNGGSFIYETGMMKFGMDMDKRQRICTPFYAFDTEEGWVLYDTGWSPSVLPLLVQLGMAPEIGEENNAVNQLKKIGVAPSDISSIILSHLHADHAGGLSFLPNATVYVQKDEYMYAFHPNSFQSLAYIQDAYNSPDIKWEILEGDQNIISGLTVFLASGHTPGLQGLLVELPESGFYILGADSAYLDVNIEKNIPPGSSWNPVLAQYAIKRFKALQAVLDAQYFPGHDLEFFEKNVKYATEYR